MGNDRLKTFYFTGFKHVFGLVFPVCESDDENVCTLDIVSYDTENGELYNPDTPTINEGVID